MKDRDAWKFRRVSGEGLACMILVRAGDLESMMALRAANPYGLALVHVMEPLKEMKSSARNSLSSSAAKATRAAAR